MSAAFDIYIPGHTWFHRLDPRVKLFFALLGAVLVIIWISLPLFLAIILLSHAALLTIGYSIAALRRIWIALAPFMLLIFLLWPLFDRTGDNVLFTAGFITITVESILTGIATALRVAAISFLFMIWLGTTDQRELVRSFVRLGLPFSLGMALTIGLRFITTFSSVFATVSDAQQSRGLILRGRGLARLRRMIPILVASLVTSLRMSEQLAWTLEARAFGATRHRTSLRDLKMRGVDWLVLIVTISGFIALLWVSFSTGTGREVLWPYTIA